MFPLGGTNLGTKEKVYNPADHSLLKLEEVLYTTEAGTVGVRTDDASAYDAAGRLSSYRYVKTAGAWVAYQTFTTESVQTWTHTYAYTYLARDGYLEQAVAGTSTNDNYRPASTTSTYDAAGRRTLITDLTVIDGAADLESKRELAYNAEGQIVLQRRWYKDGSTWKQGKDDPAGVGKLYNKFFPMISLTAWNALTDAQREGWYDKADNTRAVYVAGQQVATHTEAGNDFNATGQLTGYANTTMGKTQIQVQQGDTLKIIAQRVYGSEGYWYILADANGLDSDDGLSAGVTLNVPELKTSTNDFSTFKPYNPSDITGPTTPNMAYMPPADAGCGAVGMIIAAIVVIVVSIYAPMLAQAMTNAFAAGIGAGAGVGIGVTGAATAIGGATLVAATGIVAVGASAAARGVASVLGVASFSWKDVAVDGLTAAFSAGIAGGLQAMGSGAQAGTMASKLVTTVDGALDLSAFGRVVQGVGNYAGGVVASAAVGRDTGFSWKGVAATVVGSYVSAKIGGRVAMKDGGAPSTFGQNLLNGAVNASARRLFGMGKQDWGQIAMDAFGNTLASSISTSILTSRAAGAGISSDAPSHDQFMQSIADSFDQDPYGLFGLSGQLAVATSSGLREFGLSAELGRGWVPSGDWVESADIGMADPTPVASQRSPSRVGTRSPNGTWQLDSNGALTDTTDVLEVGVDAETAARIRRDREILRRLESRQIWSYHFGEDRDALNRDRQNGYVNPVVAQVEAGLTAPLLSHEERIRRATAYAAETGVDGNVLLSLPSPHRAPVVNPYADMSADEFRRVLGASDRQAAWDFGKGLVIGTVEGLIQTAQMASPAWAAYTMATGGEFWTPFDGPASDAEAVGRIVAPFATLGIGGPGVLSLLGRGGNASRGLSRVGSWQDVGVPPRAAQMPGGCFVAGTLVHAEQGCVAIEDVRIGDRVWSQPEGQGERELRSVVNTFVFNDKEIWRVAYSSDDGTVETLLTTANHPFWVANVGWSRADILEPGQTLELVDQRHVTIVAAENTGGVGQVHNFEVDEFHTYYVGARGVWVHNTQACTRGLLNPVGVAHAEVSVTVGRNSVLITTDANGYPLKSSGVLREYFSGASRTSAEVTAQGRAASRGIAGDQGGHLTGHRFLLDQGDKNLFPQHGNFNNSAFKTLENDYARYIDQGFEVRFNHELGGFDSMRRPSTLTVDYSVYDPSGNVVDSYLNTFKNTAGQIYKRRAFR